MAKDLGEIKFVWRDGAFEKSTAGFGNSLKDLLRPLRELSAVLRRKAGPGRRAGLGAIGKGLLGGAEAGALAASSRKVSATMARVLGRVFTAIRAHPVITAIVIGITLAIVAVVSIVKALGKMDKMLAAMTRRLSRFSGVLAQAVFASKIGGLQRQIGRAQILGPALAHNEGLRERNRRLFEPLKVALLGLATGFNRVWLEMKGKMIPMITTIVQVYATYLRAIRFIVVPLIQAGLIMLRINVAIMRVRNAGLKLLYNFLGLSKIVRWLMTNVPKILEAIWKFIKITNPIAALIEKLVGSKAIQELFALPFDDLLTQITDSGRTLMDILAQVKALSGSTQADTSNRLILNGFTQLTHGGFTFDPPPPAPQPPPSPFLQPPMRP